MARLVALSPTALILAAVSLEAELVVGPMQWAPLRIALTLVVALLLPGNSVCRAVVDNRYETLSERIAIALGLSLSLLVVGGLVLDQFGVGMRPTTWLIYLAVIIVTAEGATWWRGRTNTTDSEQALRRPRALYVAGGLVTVALLVLGFALAIRGAHRQKWSGFSQLWLVPRPNGDGYDLGLANFEGHRVAYTVKLYDGSNRVRSWGPLDTPPGKSWSVDVRLTPYVFATAVLHRDGTSGAYRRVYIRNAVP